MESKFPFVRLGNMRAMLAALGTLGMARLAASVEDMIPPFGQVTLMRGAEFF
jgi:hypothetical protein